MFTNAQLTFFGICTLAAVTIAAGQILGPKHQADLEKQCWTRDWPAEQEQAHVDYCMSLNLPVGE